MSIEKEFEGETVTDAAIEACKELGISRDELEFDVMELFCNKITKFGHVIWHILFPLGFYKIFYRNSFLY